MQGFTSNSQLAKEIIMHNEPHLLETGVDRINDKIKITYLELDNQQSLFFLSPSNKTRENAHVRVCQ